jgi:hypothetical protein
MVLYLFCMSGLCDFFFFKVLTESIFVCCRSQLSNGSLYITTMSPEQQGLRGDYQCVATLDSVGSVVSRTARFRVASECSTCRYFGKSVCCCYMRKPLEVLSSVRKVCDWNSELFVPFCSKTYSQPITHLSGLNMPVLAFMC